PKSSSGKGSASAQKSCTDLRCSQLALQNPQSGLRSGFVPVEPFQLTGTEADVMLGVLVVLAGVALAVIGLVGAGVIHSPSQAATLLLALVALHVLLGGRVLRALLVAAGVVGLVHVYGLRVVDPLLRLI